MIKLNLVLALGCIVCTEIFIRLKFLSKLQFLFFYLKKSLRVLYSKKISDHWKEKVIIYYAINLMKNSFLMLLILLTILIVFILLSLTSPNLIKYLISAYGIIESIVIVMVYLKIRQLFI